MYEKLFTPYKIGKCEIPNRLVVTAMVHNLCTEAGLSTERSMAYFEEKAKGGWGLIITEDYAVNEHAMGFQFIGGLWNDRQIESHKQMSDRVHKYESKIFCQIYHAGRQSMSFVNGGVQPVAVSPIPCPWKRQMPKELTITEIEGIVSDFGDTALRVKKAGFDGIEIHAGNGYLISGFLSLFQNKRTDRYGGCFTNRIRILKEIYTQIRSNVGADFPVMVRFSADEHVVGGRDLAETRMIARQLEEWGVDAINCSNGVYGTYNLGQVAPMYLPHAWTVRNAEELKKVVKIPILAVNRINDPLMADSLLSRGMCDFVGMARGSLADPALPNKAKSGKLESIRYCIGCNQGCVGSLGLGGQIRCLVNPELGNEYRYTFVKPKKPKNVVVVGGGVGGMQASIAAARMGHNVDLYEAGSYLGGQFYSAAFPPGKGEFATYTAWLIAELEKLGIHVHLGTKTTAQMIKEANPDKVILATGAKPTLPPIPGINRDNVSLAQDVLLGNRAVEGRILIAGGGEIGLETAAHLAYGERGAITVVEMLDTIGKQMGAVGKVHVLKILDERGVELRTNTRIVEIGEKSVALNKNGVIEHFYCDQVVIALGYTPNNSLSEELGFMGDKLVIVGDAAGVRNALEASAEGFDAGYSA